jgi:hypothetical protein
MRKLLGAAVLLAALMVVGATPAAAGNAMRALLEGTTIGFIDDPAAVAARCPAGFEWILQTAGSGELTSEAYTGPVDYTSEHCSRLLAGTLTDHAVGKADAGLLTLVTPSGDRLNVTYRGTFVFNGDTAVAWRSDVSQSFLITGGTGVFAGASGHGHLPTVDNSGAVILALNGSLALPG